MVRTDTLTNFLTDVAEAIRTKGGTTDTINASEFDTAIANLPSGSGGGSEFESEFITWLESTKNVNANVIPIPQNISAIGACSFYNMVNLSLTELPDTVQTIDFHAFYKCSSLALTKLPSSLTTLERYAFYGCTALKITSIPDGVTAIRNSCFYDCKGIERITMPPNLTDIETAAFQNCTAVVEYDFSRATRIPTLANRGFYGIKAECVIKVPSALYDEWIVATNWATYADKIVAV